MGKVKILIVEDDAPLAKMLVFLLTQALYRLLIREKKGCN